MSRKINFFKPTVNNEDIQTPRFRQSEQNLELISGSSLFESHTFGGDENLNISYLQLDEPDTPQIRLFEPYNVYSEEEGSYIMSQSLIIDYVPYINVNIIRPFRNLQDTAIQSQVITTPEQEQTCAICYEDLKLGDKTVLLSCPHLFHSKCIKEWFKVQLRRKCPMCRQIVTLK